MESWYVGSLEAYLLWTVELSPLESSQRSKSFSIEKLNSNWNSNWPPRVMKTRPVETMSASHNYVTLCNTHWPIISCENEREDKQNKTQHRSGLWPPASETFVSIIIGLRVFWFFIPEMLTRMVTHRPWGNKTCNTNLTILDRTLDTG